MADQEEYESEPHALLGAGYPPEFFADIEREKRAPMFGSGCMCRFRRCRRTSRLGASVCS